MTPGCPRPTGLYEEWNSEWEVVARIGWKKMRICDDLNIDKGKENQHLLPTFGMRVSRVQDSIIWKSLFSLRWDTILSICTMIFFSGRCTIKAFDSSGFGFTQRDAGGTTWTCALLGSVELRAWLLLYSMIDNPESGKAIISYATFFGEKMGDSLPWLLGNAR